MSTPVVILCGGEGTRFREETHLRPKPLIEIGEFPVLWHVMKLYAAQGFRDFILCLGYKGEMIKEYFLDYELRIRDFALELGRSGPQFVDDGPDLGWRITFVETGRQTMTGARLMRVQRYIDADHLMVTYADGLADIDLQRLLEFHREHGRVATVTGVRPTSPFGQIVLDGSRVTRFTEKPRSPFMVNGGFFVFRRDVFKYLVDDDGCVLEREPLEQLAAEGQLHAFAHDGFWQCLDTYKDQLVLNELWRSGRAPWLRPR
jgi:glucose-1-phosphate cytidylyltransferase